MLMSQPRWLSVVEIALTDCTNEPFILGSEDMLSYLLKPELVSVYKVPMQN